jgi:hypothetical protein
MIPPVGLAIAAMTVMLWILWSDSVRKRRPSPILYAMRIALYLIVSGVLILNMVRFPNQFAGSARAVAIMTVMVGIFGAGYFARKLVTRS